MSIPIDHDRGAQLLMAYDHSIDADLARARLEGATLLVTTDSAAAATHWCQAALLTIAACAPRMFRGGVFIAGLPRVPTLVGARLGVPLRRALLLAGCRDTGLTETPFRLHVGRQPSTNADLYASASGWTAQVAAAPAASGSDANVVGGALAGALGVSEAFRRVVLDDPLACRCQLILSAWDPAEPEADAPLSRLPAALWLLGLGNLGQALMLLVSFLPFADRHEVVLLLHDHDTVGEENRFTQVLTQPSWIGRRKARAVADFADALGFQTVVCERPFDALTLRGETDPRVALVGVDNLEARRPAADGRFDLMLDAGLGRSAEEIFDIRLHGFPGYMATDRAWPAEPAQRREITLNRGLAKLVDERRLPLCGALSIAGQSVGVPSTALAAAALQVGQLCRALATGDYCDFVDVSLRSPSLLAATSTRCVGGVTLPALLSDSG